jgi:hypothetical protein
MPQLDINIFFLNTLFLIVFLFGYIIFLMSILPLITAELKIKEKLILKHMIWFKNHMHYMVFLEYIIVNY